MGQTLWRHEVCVHASLSKWICMPGCILGYWISLSLVGNISRPWHAILPLSALYAFHLLINSFIILFNQVSSGHRSLWHFSINKYFIFLSLLEKVGLWSTMLTEPLPSIGSLFWLHYSHIQVLRGEAYVVPYRLGVGIMESEDTADTRQLLGKYFLSTINAQATLEEMLKAMFIFGSCRTK
jgi:hypothetical protein